MSLHHPAGYQLTINGQSCHTDAWECLNPEVFRDPAPRRGRNRVIPGVPGRTPVRRRRDERTVDLQFLFVGSHDPAGLVHPDPAEGLQANLEDFRAAIVDAAGDATSRLAAIVEQPNGDDLTGWVQVEEFRTSDGLYDCTAVLTVVLPDGQLEAGS